MRTFMQLSNIFNTWEKKKRDLGFNNFIGNCYLLKVKLTTCGKLSELSLQKLNPSLNVFVKNKNISLLLKYE